ncbi:MULTISPECIES: P-type conjugative transfer protein TrbJ [Pseudomonas]|uniref:P-type conjugative transfer protein TrbJ n=1 Tax=Pseudomonas TaxID=286 RepID=UPI0023D7F0B9|nr:P-type conjugative transfer protein TrbJ [Pseudomonas sp. PSE14]WEJ71961.1 P-type conjugative transfer protein TrbJ [Pseudomonas sp. PSE14]
MKPTPLLKPAIALLAGLGFTLQVHAGIPVIDGANLTNNVMTAVESVAQTLKQVEEYAKQVQQYQTQLDQYENMIQNTAAPAAYIWDQANATINKLMAAQDMLNYYTNQAGSLDSFLDKYKDVSYYKSSKCFTGGGCTSADWKGMQESQESANEAQKLANDSLYKGIEQQQASLKSDARRLEQLQTAATTADGQVKAIQYANQLASHQSNQLLQIRGLLLAQQQVLAAESSARTNAQAQEQAAHAASSKGVGPDDLPSNSMKW